MKNPRLAPPCCCRIQVADPEYKKAFNDELDAFKQRIRTRAKQKVQEQMEEMEEEERQQRLGPGGLDPAEVFETLPEVLQKCFESQGGRSMLDEGFPETRYFHCHTCCLIWTELLINF